MAEMPMLSCKRFHSPWLPAYGGRTWDGIKGTKMKWNES